MWPGPFKRATLTGTGTTSSAPAVGSLSPASGTGLTQTFTAVYSDPDGLGNLGTAKLLFNTAISGVNACDIYYTVSTNSFYLYNNADNGQAGPLTPGSSSSISNSQCTLAGTGTSVTTSGNTLTINFAITFRKHIHGIEERLHGGDQQQRQREQRLDAGGHLDTRGGWSSGGGVAVAGNGDGPDTNLYRGLLGPERTERSGDGEAAVQHGDQRGECVRHLLFGRARTLCIFTTTRAQAVYGPLTPGSSSSISNSQCTLAGTGTSVTTSGNTLTINFAITFGSTFTGSKNVYMEAINSSGSMSSGWTEEGTWTP